VFRYFEFIGADEARGTTNSAKFWQARVDGSTLLVTYGKIGSDGTTTVKEFPTPEAAEIAMDKSIAEKTRKGYVEVDPTTEAPEDIEPATPSCANCGYGVEDDARFCGNCGSPISSVEPADEEEDEDEGEDEDNVGILAAEPGLPEGLVDWVVGNLQKVYEGSKTTRIELRSGSESDFVFSVEVDSGTFDYCFSTALVDPEFLMGPDYLEFSEDDASFPGDRIHFFQPLDLHTDIPELAALVTDALRDVSTDILELWLTETGLLGDKTRKQVWGA
jgi:predicted DNA-binding WGR domain protein